MMANLRAECDFKMRVANGGLGKARHFFDFQGEKGLWEIQFSFTIKLYIFIKYIITKTIKN